MGRIKRISKAVAFWGIMLAIASNGILSFAAGPAESSSEAWGMLFGMVLALAVVGNILHRMMYGRFVGRADLRKLSPIRPAEPAE